MGRVFLRVYIRYPAVKDQAVANLSKRSRKKDNYSARDWRWHYCCVAAFAALQAVYPVVFRLGGTLPATSLPGVT